MDRSPRIALVHPTYWPEVRRGSERFAHDLGAELTKRGADVSIVTTHRGAPSVATEDGLRVVRAPRLPGRLARRSREPYAHTVWSCVPSLIRGRFDVVHALHLPTASTVLSTGRLIPGKLVVSLMGYPDERSIDAFATRRPMLEKLRRAETPIHVLSEHAGSALEKATGLRAVAINPGTHVASFATSAKRHPLPTILCAADPGDPRKRVGALVSAFARIKADLPGARLVLDQGSSPDIVEPWARQDGVEVASIGSSDLPRLMAEAWVTALPSEREAFGMVVVESLAAGTPVVVASGEAASAVVQAGRTGALFSANGPGSLVEALREGLELGCDPATREVCRARAATWDWSQIAGSYEKLYGF